MRLTTKIAAVALTLGLALGTVTAEAGKRHRDRVYADSFGNLVVDSAAGYKRIIVGQGSRAKELSDYVNAGQPPIVEYDYDEVYNDGLDEETRVFNNRGVFHNRGVFRNRGVFHN